MVSTLRAWKRRFGCPRGRSVRGAGIGTTPTRGSCAMRSARRWPVELVGRFRTVGRGLAADADALVRGLRAYDQELADRAIETALALRSVERAVEEVLLPGLEAIVGRMGAGSAARAFSARWADGLARAEPGGWPRRWPAA